MILLYFIIWQYTKYICVCARSPVTPITQRSKRLRKDSRLMCLAYPVYGRGRDFGERYLRCLLLRWLSVPHPLPLKIFSGSGCPRAGTGTQGPSSSRFSIIHCSLILALLSHHYLNGWGNCSSLGLHIVLMRGELMTRVPLGGPWQGLDMVLLTDVEVLSCWNTGCPSQMLRTEI